MASSRKATVREMEIEVRWFWRAMSDMKAMSRAGVPPSAAEMEDVMAEIEAIQCNTDWPRLKRLCAAVLAVAAPVEAMAREIMAAAL